MLEEAEGLIGDPTYTPTPSSIASSTTLTGSISTGQPATLTRHQAIQGLTAPSPNAKNCQPAWHRTPGDIMSEHRATSSRKARATSSETATRRKS